jgi:signal transduction histidine kinase
LRRFGLDASEADDVAQEVFLRGSGLVGLGDRIEALGGSFEVTSPAGKDTTMLVASLGWG